MTLASPGIFESEGVLLKINKYEIKTGVNLLRSYRFALVLYSEVSIVISESIDSDKFT